tara:strand:+ start:781 stop:1119 length:339 start_codon:yes stop_codon:yes gene_type:complete
MNYKKTEIESTFHDFISERPDEWVRDNWDDLHHHAFNTYYYIIGRARAKDWLGDEAFNAIEFVKNYEQFNFGEVSTDFSEPEQVVNRYAYILGYEIVEDWKRRKEEVEAQCA